jgi:homocysteine S-methyltransferase
MLPPAFPDFLQRHPCILGEGAVIERLRRQPATVLDPHLANSAFIYDPVKRAALEAIYRQYLDIGRAHDLPLFMTAPTWRANAGNIAAAGCGGLEVNADNLRLLQALRAAAGPYAAKVVIGGLIGCRGDAYRPEEALAAEEARVFHAWQADRLAAAGADFLLGITLPALSEATGLAAAMAATGRPYLLSFVVRPAGTLLDGTPLKEAIAALDAGGQPPPAAYLINCTHPDFARTALCHPANSSPLVRQRIIGLLANTAALSPEALDGQEHLIEEEPTYFAHAMLDLHRDLGLKILGGCCGTDDRHIRALAGLLA